MKILVASYLTRKKLLSKLLPLMEHPRVDTIYLVRRTPLEGKKIRCFSPSGIWSTNVLTAELYRIWIICYLSAVKKPDILVGIGLRMHGIYTNIAGKVFRRPTIFLSIGKCDVALERPRAVIRHFILTRLALLADFIGTRGTRSQEYFIRHGFDASRTFIPHNVFTFKEFQPVQRDKAYDFIYVGWFEPYKRVDLLITALGILKNRKGTAGFKAVLVGQGKEEKKLRALADSLNLQHEVELLPPGDDAYLQNLLNRSRVFTMSSLGEGLPMVVIEAMSCGLPVVVFNDADICDVARDGYNGLVAPPANVEVFADHLFRILTEKALYNALSSNALRLRQEKAEEYSVAYLTGLWDTVLRKVKYKY